MVIICMAMKWDLSTGGTGYMEAARWNAIQSGLLAEEKLMNQPPMFGQRKYFAILNPMPAVH